jgi:hypothetical protein
MPNRSLGPVTLYLPGGGYRFTHWLTARFALGVAAAIAAVGLFVLLPDAVPPSPPASRHESAAPPPPIVVPSVVLPSIVVSRTNVEPRSADKFETSKLEGTIQIDSTETSPRPEISVVLKLEQRGTVIANGTKFIELEGSYTFFSPDLPSNTLSGRIDTSRGRVLLEGRRVSDPGKVEDRFEGVVTSRSLYGTYTRVSNGDIGGFSFLQMSPDTK